MNIKLSILGDFAVTINGNDCTPTAPKVRQVLALLIANAGHGVPIDLLITELWDQDPPASAVTTVQTYVYQLRKALQAHATDEQVSNLVVTRGGVYTLNAPGCHIDEARFRVLVDRGRAACETGDYVGGSTILREAASLWRGRPFTGVEMGARLDAHAVHLEEVRYRAEQLLIECDLNRGRHHELIPELRRMLCQNPLDEWLHGKLIQALGRAGRRGDALAAYDHMRKILDAELGLLPSAESRRLHLEVLNA